MKQYNIIIRGSGEKHYNIVVRSGYHISATLDELPTYVYNMLHNSLILLSNPANPSLQKYLHLDELVAILREAEADPLKSSFVSSESHVVLKELSPGILVVKVVEPSEVSELLLEQSQAAIATGAFPHPVRGISVLSQSAATISNGFWGDGTSVTVLAEDEVAPLVISHSGWSGSSVLRQIVTLSHTEKYSKGETGATLQEPTMRAHSENFSSASNTKFAMAQSSMTFSYGFNAVCSNGFVMRQSAPVPLVNTAVVSAEDAFVVKEEDARTNIDKFLPARHVSKLRVKQADAISGHPRRLYEMDDKPMSAFDTMTMDDVDFIR